jgi:hypothetical protein
MTNFWKKRIYTKITKTVFGLVNFLMTAKYTHLPVEIEESIFMMQAINNGAILL